MIALLAACARPPDPPPLEFSSTALVRFPLDYCVDRGLASVVDPSRVRLAFDLWDDEMPLELFRYLGICDDVGWVDLFLEYDLQATGLISLVTSNTYVLTVSGSPFVPLFSQSAVDAGECTDGYSVEFLLAHEAGHILGIGHSCEEGEACSSDEAEALMSGVFVPCRSPLALTEWDREALASAIRGSSES